MIIFNFVNVRDVGQNKSSFLLCNCDIFVKQKITIINETKRDEILLKLKVCDQENLHGILKTFVKVIDESWPNFGHY